MRMLQIFVEIERARLTKQLAKLKEEEGKVDEAAEILQEVAVVRMLSLKAVSHQMIPVSDFTSLRPAGPTKQGYGRIS